MVKLSHQTMKVQTMVIKISRKNNLACSKKLQSKQINTLTIFRNESSKVAKLSPIRTYFSLLKGFVCTGILYMPKNFKNSGWAWGGCAMFLSFILTQICADKILQARQRHPRASFTDLGRLSMGKPGQILVDVFLTVAQVGFLIGQTYFIASNLKSVFLEAFDLDINILWFGNQYLG